jgi:hypothetical protein
MYTSRRTLVIASVLILSVNIKYALISVNVVVFPNPKGLRRVSAGWLRHLALQGCLPDYTPPNFLLADQGSFTIRNGNTVLSDALTSTRYIQIAFHIVLIRFFSF